MVCVSQWCNGLCSLVVKWFLLLGGVMICDQWSNGLCFSVV